MQKIIRERYENGVLIAREIEVSGVRWHKAAKLLIHSVIALSLAVLAYITARDSQLIHAEIGSDGATTMEYACPSPHARDAT